jgi:hypothetical protein
MLASLPGTVLLLPNQTLEIFERCQNDVQCTLPIVHLKVARAHASGEDLIP